MRCFTPVPMCFVLFLLALAMTPAQADCSHTLRVHTSKVSASVYYRDLRWLQHVLAGVGCRVSNDEEEVASFGRILRSLEDGKHDFALGLSRTPEREALFYFSPAYTRDNLRVYVSRNNTQAPSTLTLEALSNYKNALLIPLHGWYGDAFEQFRQRHQLSAQVLTYQNDPDGVRLAVNNPDILLIMSERIFESFATKEAKEQLRKLEPALFSDPLHIAFSRKSISAEEFAYLNAAIEAALKSGNTPEKMIK